MLLLSLFYPWGYGTHTAGTGQIQDLNPGPLPIKAFVSLATNVFGSVHKREKRLSF